MSRSMSPTETAHVQSRRRRDPATGPRVHEVAGKWMRGLVGAGVVFGLVELLTRAGLVSASYLPPASSILRETVGLFGEGEFRTSLWVTVKACLIGLSLSVLVAVPAGLVLGLSPIVHKATSTILEFLRPIPSVALIPLAIMLYGRGTEMKVALVIYACVWPILFNTIYGIRSVDPVADRHRPRVRARQGQDGDSRAPAQRVAVRVHGRQDRLVDRRHPRRQRRAARRRSPAGIGILMLEASSIGDQPRVYALTIVTGLIGLVLNLGFTSVERRIFPWNVQDDEAS